MSELSGIDRAPGSADDDAGSPTAGYGRRALMLGAAAAGAGLAASVASGAAPADAASPDVLTVDHKSGFVADGGGSVTTGYGTNSSTIAFGVNAAGTHTGVFGTGPIGVSGQGQGGPGGKFASGGTPPGPPQIHVNPHATADPGGAGPAAPRQFEKPERILPPVGTVGDMWFSQSPAVALSAALWLCVTSSAGILGRSGFRPAMWCQVLLGSPIPGEFPVPNV